MVDTKYTGHDVVVKIDTVEHLANISISKTRDVINVPSGNLIGKMKEGGQFDVTGTMTLTYRKGAQSAKVTGGSPTTGAAETLKTGVSVAADGDTAMDDTTIASASKVRASVATSAMTTGGDLDVHGEDVNGNDISETLVFDGDEGVGEYKETSKLFKKVFYVYVRGIRSTGSGTLTIASIAGAATVTVGEATEFDLEVDAIKSSAGKYCKLYLPNCFATKEGFEMTDANSYIGQPVEFSMKNANEFYEEYLD